MPLGQLPHPCAPLIDEELCSPIALGGRSYVLEEGRAGVITLPQKKLPGSLLTPATEVPAPTQRERRSLQTQRVSVGRWLSSTQT